MLIKLIINKHLHFERKSGSKTLIDNSFDQNNEVTSNTHFYSNYRAVLVSTVKSCKACNDKSQLQTKFGLSKLSDIEVSEEFQLEQICNNDLD